MLRSEGGNSLVDKLFVGKLQGISDRKDSRIKNTDNVSSIGLIHDFSFVCHHLGRLGKLHLSTSLNMVYFHSRIKFSGADPHKSHSVTVLWVHIGLNFKDKGGKCLFHRINHALVGLSGKGRLGHRQEMLQKGLHTKVS